MSRPGTRGFLLAGLLVVLLVAGVGSHYASSSPDALEHVGGETGFLDSARESPTADGPFADYRTAGVDGDRLSGGLAGVAGVASVLVLTGVLTMVVRRRPDRPGARVAAGDADRDEGAR